MSKACPGDVVDLDTVGVDGQSGLAWLAACFLPSWSAPSVRTVAVADTDMVVLENALVSYPLDPREGWDSAWDPTMFLIA